MLLGAGVDPQRLKPTRFPLPSLAPDLLVGRWPERLPQMLGRIGGHPREMLVRWRPMPPGVSRGLTRRVARAQRVRGGWLPGERLTLGKAHGELERRVKDRADARLPLPVLGDPLRVAADAIVIGAVDAEVHRATADGLRPPSLPASRPLWPCRGLRQPHASGQGCAGVGTGAARDAGAATLTSTVGT